MEPRADDTEQPVVSAWPAFACAGFVLLAVVLEFLGGNGGTAAVVGLHQTSEHTWRDFVPSAWPEAPRVIWWLAVAGATAGYRLHADRMQHRAPRAWLAVVSAAPFLVFAGGVATSMGWATFR